MLNSAILIGRLVNDPELRTTPNNVSVTSFRIAVDRNYQKQGEERQADFIDIVAWRQTADFVTRYFRKGSMIAVQGSIQTRSYEDKQGNKRTAVEVVADNVSFCGSKAENGKKENVNNNLNVSPPDDNTPSYSSSYNADFEPLDDEDDDCPF